MDKAMNQMSAGFARSPEEREKHLQIAGRRERGLARAKARSDKVWAEKHAKDAADALERDRANRGNLEAELANLQKQFDPNFEYSDDYSFWSKQKGIQAQIAGLKRRLSQLDEEASAGATSSGNVPGLANPKAAHSKKTVQPKKSNGTAVNALDMDVSLFGGTNGSAAIKRR